MCVFTENWALAACVGLYLSDLLIIYNAAMEMTLFTLSCFVLNGV